MKKKVNERGAKGLLALVRCFRQMDADGSKKLSSDEFKQGLRNFKLAFDEADVEVLFHALDKDRDSLIDAKEFLSALRVGERAMNRGS